MRISLETGKQYKLSNNNQVSKTEKQKQTEFFRASKGRRRMKETKNQPTIIAIIAACSFLFASSSADDWP
jgi:hypothetical protein